MEPGSQDTVVQDMLNQPGGKGCGFIAVIVFITSSEEPNGPVWAAVAAYTQLNIAVISDVFFIIILESV